MTSSGILFAQEGSAQRKDTLKNQEVICDTATFIIRTDALDLLTMLIEPEKIQFTFGVEYLMDKNYSIRLQARVDKFKDKNLKSTEFSCGPEVIKYFASNVNGSFYGGIFFYYYSYNNIKNDGLTTTEQNINKLNSGIVSGYCYVLEDHFILEPSIKIGFLSLPDSGPPPELRIALHVGYLF